MLRFICIAGPLLAAGLTGCTTASPASNGPGVRPQASTAAPIRDELFTAIERERTIAASVGVEMREAPRLTLIPAFQPIEPTPEQRAILGERPDPLDDLFAFYRPPRGADDGVLPVADSDFTGVDTSFLSPASILLQRYSGSPAVDISAYESHGWLIMDRSRSAVLLHTDRPAMRYLESGADVGENEARDTSARMPRIYD